MTTAQNFEAPHKLLAAGDWEPPDGLWKPERDQYVLMARASGDTFHAIAKRAGLAVSNVFHICSRHSEWIEAAKKRIAQNILENFDNPTVARLVDASNPESRTGPQSYRALAEVAGIIGRGLQIGGDLTINTQVNVSLAGLDLTHDANAETSARRLLGLGD